MFVKVANIFFTNYRHTCVLPNHQFYFYILAVSSALLCIYILCNLYNLVRKKAKYVSKLFPRRSIDVELLNISEYFFLKIVRQVPLHKSFANLLQIGKGHLTLVKIGSFSPISLQVWIIWPQMGRMFRIIRKYRYQNGMQQE